MLRILTGSTTEVTVSDLYNDDEFIAIQVGLCLHLIKGKHHIFLDELETLLFMTVGDGDFETLFEIYLQEQVPEIA